MENTIKINIKKIKQSEMYYNFKGNTLAKFGFFTLSLIILIAIFGNFIVVQNPYNLQDISLSDSFLPPAFMEGGTIKFPLGTDEQGRDVLSAIVYGSRVSLFIGFTGMILSCSIGTVMGLLAGYFGGKMDAIIMRIADIQLSFPTTLIAIFIMTMFGRGIDKILIALTLVGWVRYARTVRGSVLSIKKQEYIEASKVIGLPDRVIIFKHVLPNALTSIIVLSTMQIGSFILTEATLSFLGVGVPITKPSLGLLVKNGFDVLFSGLWWASFFPGIYIMLIVFSINLLGDFLRDELNPKLK